MAVVGWILFAGWALWAAILWLSVRSMRTLPGDVATDAAPPVVSVVVAARDEAARIGRTIDMLLAQTGVDLEVVAVDDRSTDGTGAILGERAAGDPRLQVVRVDELPEGWLGKNHACAVAARRARGDWLLFTDADAWMQPTLVARAVARARADDVPHLCLVPGEGPSTSFGRAGHLLFFLTGSPAVALCNADRWSGPMGVGAFNLVRRDAYDSIGGHRDLAMEVVDDAMLGRLLHRAGLRTRVYGAAGDLEIRWARTLRGLVKALDKNLFAAFGYRVWLALPIGLGGIAAWAATLTGPWAAGLAVVILPALLAARRARYRPGSAILVPLAIPVLAWALVSSTARTLLQGGVRWRDTFYPLERLRRERVR